MDSKWKGKYRPPREANTHELPELPMGWGWATVEQLAAAEDHSMTDGPFGSNLKTEHYASDGPRVIRLQNIGSCEFIDEKAHISNDRFLKLKKHAVHGGDIVIRSLGFPSPTACMIPDWVGDAIVKADCFRYKVAEPFVNPKYVMYALNSPSTQKRTEALVHGVGRPRLNLNEVKSIPLPLPPLAEQHRIVSKIEELFTKLDSGVEELKEAKARLRRYRQAVLKSAFEGKLTEGWRQVKQGKIEPASMLLERIKLDHKNRIGAKTKEQSPVHSRQMPILPEGWEWTTWGQVGFSQNGRAFPSKEYCSMGVKLLRPGNLHESGQVVWSESNTRCMPIEWEKEHPVYVIGPNQLVINLTAQSLKDEFLGRVCLTDANEHCLLNQRIARLTPFLIPEKFFLWLFKSKLFREYVDSLNTGSLIQHMFTSQLESFRFPLPPLEEQFELVRIVEEKCSNIAAVELNIDVNLKRANILRKSILMRAFDGKLVSQDHTDEQAEKLLERIRESVSKVTPIRKKQKTNGATPNGK